MLSLEYPGRTRLCDGWSRRELLRAGSLSALGLTLADLWTLQPAPARPATPISGT